MATGTPSRKIRGMGMIAIAVGAILLFSFPFVHMMFAQGEGPTCITLVGMGAGLTLIVVGIVGMLSGRSPG